ncbi:MAG TPA: endosialidase [Candidatus Limivivens merdigallinarum]|uniref:Endosialidase n=1 Tax=Candidatus Limivivens merdigallinarum TaxID=2840859 RepID=A0A9D0ZU41_9FIRM|nr:endosialidase [Candidatus Limivivens merdigallinarum]
MSVITELIREEADGTLSFGNYELAVKSKKQDFEYEGDLYKVKTFKEITKLERNGMFVYESVPGTAVSHMDVTENTMSFEVEGTADAQITVELEEDTSYQVFVNEKGIGEMKTNLGGKLVLSVELETMKSAKIRIEKI